MVTIKSRDQESVAVKIEVKRDHPDFDDILAAIKATPGRYYDAQEYSWIIPKKNARMLCENLDRVSRVAFLSKESDIFGTQPKISMPEFEVKEDFLNEFALQPFPYQKVGICFLHDVKKAIIADEMGLGKTVQIMGAVWRLFREKILTRSLIVVPSSVLYQWKEEIEKFLPEATSIIIDGTVTKRKKIYAKIQDESPLFCLIGHEMMRNDIDILTEMPWGCVAIDEGHRIRNYDTQLTKAAKKLKADYKFIATGTPIQSHPEEIWSLFDFIDPTIFGSWFYFRKKYIILGEKFGQRNAVIGYQNLEDLYQKIGTRMLRRLKIDVDMQLPRLLINNYRVEMTSAQRRIHDMIQEDLGRLLEQVEKFRQYNSAGEIIKEHPAAASVLGLFTMLQEVADTPELLMLSGSKLAEAYLPFCNTQSGKIDEIKDIIRDLVHYDKKLKVILFSQYERMQGILVRELTKFGKCICLNGKMNAAEKQIAINKFRDDPSVMFFISSDAGNFGINLQVASTVINVDLPWNPATWKQRYSRAHRIGSQHEHINVINIISQESIDESIYNTMYNRSLNADMLTDRDAEERKILAVPDNGNIKNLITKIKAMERR